MWKGFLFVTKVPQAQGCGGVFCAGKHQAILGGKLCGHGAQLVAYGEQVSGVEAWRGCTGAMGL